MSFKKAKNQDEIDALVKEFVDTRRELQIKSTAEKLGVEAIDKKIERAAKPVISAIKEQEEGVIGALAIEGVKANRNNLLNSIRFELLKQGVSSPKVVEIFEELDKADSIKEITTKLLPTLLALGASRVNINRFSNVIGKLPDIDLVELMNVGIDNDIKAVENLRFQIQINDVQGVDSTDELEIIDQLTTSIEDKEKFIAEEIDNIPEPSKK